MFGVKIRRFEVRESIHVGLKLIQVVNSVTHEHCHLTRPQRTHLYRFIQLAIFSDYKNFIPLESLVYTDDLFIKFLFYL